MNHQDRRGYDGDMGIGLNHLAMARGVCSCDTGLWVKTLKMKLQHPLAMVYLLLIHQYRIFFVHVIIMMEDTVNTKFGGSR